jgi:hypothetical protein
LIAKVRKSLELRAVMDKKSKNVALNFVGRVFDEIYEDPKIPLIWHVKALKSYLYLKIS